MSDWVIPAPLNKPAPRKIEMIPAMKWMIAVIVTVPMIFILIILAATVRKMHTLEERSVDTLATIAKLVVDPQRHEHRVYYAYQPKEFAGRPYSTIHGDDTDVPQEFYRLKTGGAVWVVYDPKDPERSALKWSVELARGRSVWPSLWIVGSMAVVLPCLFGGILSIPYWRARHLLRWGTVAEATITGEVPRDGSNGFLSVVSYRFQDDRGMIVNGENTRLPSAGNPYPEAITLRATMLENRTVIFDPRKSRRHVLYPSGFARVVSDG